MLAANTALKTLSLGENPIGPAGTASLAAALAPNATLAALNLCDAREDDAAAALARALTANSALATLGLLNNKIADAGATVLAGALAPRKQDAGIA